MPGFQVFYCGYFIDGGLYFGIFNKMHPEFAEESAKLYKEQHWLIKAIQKHLTRLIADTLPLSKMAILWYWFMVQFSDI